MANMLSETFSGAAYYRGVRKRSIKKLKRKGVFAHLGRIL